jgi:hypothetical protein
VSEARSLGLGPTRPPKFTDAPLEPTLEPRPLSNVPPAPDRLRDEPLPDRYEDDRITLICRDPNWLHAYWDLNPASVSRARGLLDDAADHFVLRLHHFPALAGQASGQTDIEVNAAARNWYLHGGRPGHAFEIEIGLRAADGRFVPLARSNRVTAPLDRMSEVVDEKWRLLAEDAERMYTLSGGYSSRASASGELPELMTRRMDELMGSGVGASFGLWSASAPQPPGAGHPGFWFVLGTELIVYGATDPGATVTCQGRPVPLRPDGTFTLRFALPDGAQEIACRATSADRLEAISITPALTKTTTREEQSHRSSDE